MKNMSLEQETEDTQKFPLFISNLCCLEETLDGDFVDNDNVFKNNVCSTLKFSPFPNLLEEHELFWEDSEIDSLISKDKSNFWSYGKLISDGSLMDARKEAVDWILRVNAHYGFCALTAVLAVNYFDRFMVKIRFQRDKPWKSQLTAVACLSIAAKVQEIQMPPLLLDFLVEESKCVFEAKNVGRMELLVMSTLQWRMHPVTPVAFFDHIARRLILNWEFLWRCEDLLLSAIADVRFGRYVPSVMAAAIMLSVIKESEPCNALEHQEHLLTVLKTNEEKVNECCEIIQEVLDRDNKRKRLFVPCRPNGVMDASFSCNNSNHSIHRVSYLQSSQVSRREDCTISQGLAHYSLS